MTTPSSSQQSYYSVLSDDHVDPSAPPQCTSTPVNSVRHKSEKNVSKPANKLTTVIANNQSIKSKNEMIWKVIDTRKPEIVVVSETWLNNSIHYSEVLPTNYEVYYKDRIDGGVLIAVKNTLISQGHHDLVDRYGISVSQMTTNLFYLS